MRYLLLFIIFLSFETSAQVLQNFVEPAGKRKVFEAKGDLDKDGVDEIVMAYNTGKQVDRLGYTRELYICKVINGSLKLWKQNTSVLWNSDDCGFCTDNGINLSIKIKNNTMIIEQTFWHNTRHTSIHKNIYRYQNNDWFLIGSTYNDDYNCGYHHTYDINFSTKQVHVSYDNEDCEDSVQLYPASEKSFKYPFKSIPKMDGFTPGKTEIKIPNSKQFFYY
ncbi:hypothetical protein [Pedobacter sp. Leaf250]|uniref:hypothetical protein n=1 Tax=Pedobacter sp. Leaf250 TaxID=2876559 RepID=UPI001E4CDB32|nr:hypothetical protein [Pedobacter sp. Leaf250]